MAPGDVAWDVDRYNLPHGEEVAGVLIYVPGRLTRVNTLRPSKKGGAPVAWATAVRHAALTGGRVQPGPKPRWGGQPARRGLMAVG